MDNKNIGKRQNTMTKTLINNVGLEEVEKLWIQYGCYKAADELSKMLDQYISFSTIKYLSQVFNWRRPINKLSPMYNGYLAGNVDPRQYKHLIFPEVNKNEQNIFS